MARTFFPPSQRIHLKFREAPSDLLTDFLINLNKRNKDHLTSLSQCSGNFKDQRLTGKSRYFYYINR